MKLTFEWNENKARSNIEKHGLSFEEAATAFGDPLSLAIEDPEHSADESRFVLLGTTLRNKLVVVVHAERGDTIRIISARLATRAERRAYEHA